MDAFDPRLLVAPAISHVIDFTSAKVNVCFSEKLTALFRVKRAMKSLLNTFDLKQIVYLFLVKHTNKSPEIPDLILKFGHKIPLSK